MTGYSDSRAADVDYALRESEHEPPIEEQLTEEELAERDADFARIADELAAEGVELLEKVDDRESVARADRDLALSNEQVEELITQLDATGQHMGVADPAVVAKILATRKPVISIDLLREDSDAIREYASNLILAIMRWEEHSIAYSHRINRLIAAGDGDALLRYLLEMGENRSAVNRALTESIVMDWRVALLTSAEMTGKMLEHWLPEYKGRWKAK